jgi:hypothetical protein
MQVIRKKLREEVQPAGFEIINNTNNINDIILSRVNVGVLPNNTGIVSLPINLSLWISRISDIAERINTTPKVKTKAMIKAA